MRASYTLKINTMKEPYLKTGAKETIKDSFLKLLRFEKPIVNRISKKEVVIKAVKGRGKRAKEIITHTYTNEVNVVTEIRRKKDNTKTIKVRTEVQPRFLFKI